MNPKNIFSLNPENSFVDFGKFFKTSDPTENLFISHINISDVTSLFLVIRNDGAQT